jgi:hypothetical protein
MWERWSMSWRTLFRPEAEPSAKRNLHLREMDSTPPQVAGALTARPRAVEVALALVAHPV